MAQRYWLLFGVKQSSNPETGSCREVARLWGARAVLPNSVGTMIGAEGNVPCNISQSIVEREAKCHPHVNSWLHLVPVRQDLHFALARPEDGGRGEGGCGKTLRARLAGLGEKRWWVLVRWWVRPRLQSGGSALQDSRRNAVLPRRNIQWFEIFTV